MERGKTKIQFFIFRNKIRLLMAMAPMPSWRTRPGKLLSRDMPKKDESPAEERGLLNKQQSRIPLVPFSDRLQEVQAQALDDIGDTTRRLVEHDKKEGQTRSKLRRKVRVAAWFVQVLVFWGCWKLFHFGSHMSSITQRYDPKVGIDLEVRGCDVDFTAGDEPTVTYTARMMAAHASWHKSTSDSTSTQYATVSNKIGCGGLRPGDGCRRVCLVTVSVTPEAARLSTFRIDQEADDTDSPTISLMPQTSIATLLVSPAVDPPSNESGDLARVDHEPADREARLWRDDSTPLVTAKRLCGRGCGLHLSLRGEYASWLQERHVHCWLGCGGHGLAGALIAC